MLGFGSNFDNGPANFYFTKKTAPRKPYRRGKRLLKKKKKQNKKKPDLSLIFSKRRQKR